MSIMPSFQKSLMVEQFQGNYLKYSCKYIKINLRIFIKSLHTSTLYFDNNDNDMTLVWNVVCLFVA